MNTELNPSFGDAMTVITSGDTTVYTPQAGKRLRLKWIGLSSPSTNTGNVTVIVKLSKVGGAPSQSPYKWEMGAPGAFAHRTRREGKTDEALIVRLSSAQTVQVNFDVEEFV